MWRLCLRQRRSGQTDAPISDPSAVLASRTYITLKFCNAASRTWGATCLRGSFTTPSTGGGRVSIRGSSALTFAVPTGGESRGSPSLRSRLTSGFVKGGSERPQDCQGKAPIDFGPRKPRVTDGRGLCYARVLRTGGASYEETDSDLRRDRRCAADVDPSSGQRSGQRP